MASPRDLAGFEPATQVSSTSGRGGAVRGGAGRDLAPPDLAPPDLAPLGAVPPDLAPLGAAACWRRAHSPASRIRPFTARKIAVSTGLANVSCTVCWSSAPAMPTGIVAKMIIQASFWSAVSIRRRAIEVKNPPTIRSQSRQK